MGISSFFPFKKSAQRLAQKPNPEATYLLASILVVFPEIARVSYDPKDELLELSFALDGQLSRDEFQIFTMKVVESIRTYHEITGLNNARLETSIEGIANVSFLQIRRDLKTLTRGELSIITSIAQDLFEERLIIENDDPDDAEEEMMLAQEEKIDQVFGRLRQNKISDRLVGIRENEKVVVYIR